MKVCVIGSGGREHAFAASLSRTAEVVVTPGSPGIPGSTDQPVEEIDADLFVVGPEVPLVDGLADRLRARGRSVFGPGADGARLEGSKEWMKDLVSAAGVPTARYGSFGSGDVDAALAFLSSLAPPYVIKTDGLAAGKGVLVTDDHREAVEDVRSKLSGQAFGDAGRRVVIEELGRTDGAAAAGTGVQMMADEGELRGHRMVTLRPAQVQTQTATDGRCQVLERRRGAGSTSR